MSATKTQKPKKDTRTPYKRAYDEWWESDGGRASEARTLGTDNPDYYLANRLKNAFRAGYNAKP